MKVFKWCVSLTGFVAMAVSASGATIAFTGGILKDATGTTPTANDFDWIVKADVGGDGFDPPTPGDFLGGTDDDIIVLGGIHVSTNPLGAGSIGDTIDYGDPGTPPAGVTPDATEIQLVWFPTLTADTDTPTAGIPYGTYRTDTADDGTTLNGWTYPDGAIDSLFFLNADAGSTGAGPDDLNADLTVVPEPSSTLLAFLGAALFLRRRRS